jgi:hypothetical protein
MRVALYEAAVAAHAQRGQVTDYRSGGPLTFYQHRTSQAESNKRMAFFGSCTLLCGAHAPRNP